MNTFLSFFFNIQKLVNIDSSYKLQQNIHFILRKTIKLYGVYITNKSLEAYNSFVNKTISYRYQYFLIYKIYRKPKIFVVRFDKNVCKGIKNKNNQYIILESGKMKRFSNKYQYNFEDIIMGLK